MSNVEFEETVYGSSQPVYIVTTDGALLRFLINRKIVKDRAQAYLILSGIILTCVFVSLYLIYNTFFKPPTITYLEDLTPEQRAEVQEKRAELLFPSKYND